ncbi:Na+/H+ antiporter NhaA [Microvirga massiliensis]|uniref:Na+/H+ antiporter NhaA n=1 Tax=Microvirga massiliensis TaxID=1033741 RepID=UPI0007C6510C|nr:Na+/H+ antiporter NhaA [Microvirga massiliensis]
MARSRPHRLDPPVDAARDHILDGSGADMTLVEYGSYASRECCATHEIVSSLRDRFGDRLRYVYRHFPRQGHEDARAAAELAEYAFATTGRFWPVHEALMTRGPAFAPGDLERIAAEFDLPARDEAHMTEVRAAARRVRDDVESARRSGALVAPTFFINGRRYEGPWDASSLAEALLGSLGHRLHTATLDFVRWGPSAGLLLLLMSVLAVVLANSPVGPAFLSWWQAPFGVRLGDSAFNLPLVAWINDGLLSLFFLVVGLEIKREFTVGRLATRRAAAFPVIAAVGGMIVPTLIYLAIVPPGPLIAGWATTISTDTAFAVALIAFLGNRVPVELRVFLTAAVVMDDLAAIAVLALFYADAIHIGYLAASVGVTGMLLGLNRWGVYRPLPYAVLGVVLWACVHESGLHATLAGVILAVVTPTRPPANLRALMAQAETVIRAETRRANEAVMRHGPSEPTLQALDVIHDRIESPASKLLRSVEPWSSYAVLPLFALANAGVVWAPEVLEGHGRLMLAIILGLVIGKPVGITLFAWLAVRLRLAAKSEAYTWRQLFGAGALAGIGFTMSLFIAGQAFTGAEFAASKIAIFAASLTAGVLGSLILWPRASFDASERQGGETAVQTPPLRGPGPQQ